MQASKEYSNFKPSTSEKRKLCTHMKKIIDIYNEGISKNSKLDICDFKLLQWSQWNIYIFLCLFYDFRFYKLDTMGVAWLRSLGFVWVRSAWGAVRSYNFVAPEVYGTMQRVRENKMCTSSEITAERPDCLHSEASCLRISRRDGTLTLQVLASFSSWKM